MPLPFPIDDPSHPLYPPLRGGFPCLPRERHGNPPNQRNPTSLFHLTSRSLQHNLDTSIVRGDVYFAPDFLVRAETWYKAEVDRLIGLHTLAHAAGRPVPLSAGTATVPASASAIKSKAKRTPRRPRPETPPLRIQPSRAVKRVASPAPASARSRLEAAVNRALDWYTDGMPGSYVLTTFSSARFVAISRDYYNGDEDDGGVAGVSIPPPQISLLKGQEVVDFLGRLGVAIRTKAKAARQAAREREAAAATTAAAAAAAVVGLTSTSSSCFLTGRAVAGRYRPAPTWAGMLPPPPLPTTTTTTTGRLRLLPLPRDWTLEQVRAWEAAEEGRIARLVPAAADAVMEISPTLGQFPLAGEGAGVVVEGYREEDGAGTLGVGDSSSSSSARAWSRKRGSRREDPRELLVEIDGLRFAVDVCSDWDGSGEKVLIAMM